MKIYTTVQELFNKIKTESRNLPIVGSRPPQMMVGYVLHVRKAIGVVESDLYCDVHCFKQCRVRKRVLTALIAM